MMAVEDETGALRRTIAMVPLSVRPASKPLNKLSDQP